MIRFCKMVLMMMGGLFIIELLCLAYLVIVDPFHLRPLLRALLQHPVVATQASSSVLPVGSTSIHSVAETSSTVVTKTTPSSTTAVKSVVTPAQKAALESVGINPGTFSNGITPAQLQCFTTILGALRVAEIKAGAIPSASEFFSVRGCL